MISGFLFLGLIVLLVVGVLTAALYREGDLLAWSRHKITRSIFAVIGLILVAVLVIPELRETDAALNTNEPITVSMPTESLTERFPRPTEALENRSSTSIPWSGGRMIVNILYIDTFGTILGKDDTVVDWDGDAPLILKGEHDLDSSTVEYEVKVEGVKLRYTEEGCSLVLDAEREVRVRYGGGSSGTSGGMGSPDQEELYVMTRLNGHRQGGFHLRRRHERSHLTVVALFHPLPSPETATVTVPAHEYLEPYLTSLISTAELDAHSNYHRGRSIIDTPPFIRACSAIGSASPLILLAGFVFIALAAPKHRALMVLGALLATSLTLVAVDKVITRRALAIVVDESYDPAIRASALDTASASFFHTSDAADTATELLTDATLDKSIQHVAWWLKVVEILETLPEPLQHRDNQIASGYDHDHADSWYGIWHLDDDASKSAYLVIRPTPHDNRFDMRWVQAELLAAGIAPGLVVYKHEAVGRSPDGMVRVGGDEQVQMLLELCGDKRKLLASELWTERIAPVLNQTEKDR